MRDLAIGGKEIMELGVTEGPQIGMVLKQLIEFVLDDPNLNTPEQLLDIVKTKILSHEEKTN